VAQSLMTLLAQMEGKKWLKLLTKMSKSIIEDLFNDLDTSNNEQVCHLRLFNII